MSHPDPAHEPGSELRRRRDELAEQVAELHWNLGGLTYEMAIRDHFRLDLLVRRAAMLQERDAELAEVERLLHMEESAVAGSCSSCGAVRSRGAVFCWQCGAKVMERASDANGKQAEKAGDVEAQTVEIDVAAVTRAGKAAHPARVSAVSQQGASHGATQAHASPHVEESTLGRSVQASP